ncbi:copper resistance D family protein [Sphingomonas pokkalii]|nr:CopD family protein [Sphingomonas pokkalii]
MLEALAALAKGIGYAGALTAAGTILARASWARGGGATSRAIAAGVTRLAGIALAISAAGEALLFFVRLGGGADAATLDALFLSPLGAALGLHLIGGVWAATFARRRLALAGAAMILAAFGVVGHAATNGIVTSITVILHVTAAAWWLGGLWILLGASRTSAAEFPALVDRFSRQAVGVVGVLLAAALTTTAALLDLRIDLARAYQQGLLVKLAFTGALLVLAGINKLILTPRLAARADARVWLRRAIVAEILLFVGALTTTAYLTTYLSPHDADEAAHAHGDAGAAHGPIAVVDPWAAAVPGGAMTGVGYMTIVNNQPMADRLIGASSPGPRAEEERLRRVGTGAAHGGRGGGDGRRYCGRRGSLLSGDLRAGVRRDDRVGLFRCGGCCGRCRGNGVDRCRHLDRGRCHRRCARLYCQPRGRHRHGDAG